MQKYGNEPVVMQSEERRQAKVGPRGWSPENGSNLSLIEQYIHGSQKKSEVHLLLCTKDKQDKSAAPYLLSVQQV